MKTTEIRESDLRFWKLFDVFVRHLKRVGQIHPSKLDEPHPSRTLGSHEYLSLWLLAMVNPVIKSMRGLCQASELGRVQQELGCASVSLGSFSEAQAVLDTGVLPELYESLHRELAPQLAGASRTGWPARLQLVDSSVWEAVSRMEWAHWRDQNTRQHAVRVHFSFNLADDTPERIEVGAAKRCERAALKAGLKPGEFYVGDRNFSRDHALLNLMQVKGCDFILRLLHQIEPVVLETYPLSPEQTKAGIISDQRVRLGTRPRDGTVPLRRIEIAMEDSCEPLVLITNQPPEVLDALEVSEIYRARWRIELYFKWIKSILGNRALLAYSPEGVAIQMYMALIAALLLQALSGKRPTKRQMEMIQFYLSGMASLDELLAKLKVENLET